MSSVLQRRALRLDQVRSGPLYVFSLKASEILEVAELARINRDRTGELIGYQRGPVKRHIDDILEYLDGDEVLFPNPIVLALSGSVRFRRSRGPGNADDVAEAGTLEIPLPRDGEPKPAWIVDGQQRALALARTRRQDLAVPVNAFVAPNVALQRDQFIRVNNARPLPRGLITELLPEVSSPLPANLAPRRLPSSLCDALNADPGSPFCGLIKRPSSVRGSGAVITDTALIESIKESLTTPSGCLFPYQNLAEDETDVEAVWWVLVTYWKGVRATFPDAWGRPPTESRLMHGAGIRAMGRLMDKVMGSIHPGDPKADRRVMEALARVEPGCRWQRGTWDGIGLGWNEVENTPKHIRLLSNHLVRLYISLQAA